MNHLENSRRFSFKLNGENIWNTEFETEILEEGNTLTTVYRFASGVKVTNVLKKYDKYGAYEWVNYFENTSNMPSKIISELWDCDCLLQLDYEENRRWEAYFPNVDKATKIYAPCGSIWSKKEFYCDIDKIEENDRIYHITPGQTKKYSTSGGRSSEKNAPFFNISKNGKGYIVAVGWTGQWNAQFTRINDGITVKSGIEDTNFKLMPSESFRTSSVVIMPYTENETAHNKWRRLVKEHFSLIGSEGRDSNGFLCANVWGGMPSAAVLERIKAVKDNGLPFECLWMDAGWYGHNTQPTPDEFEGDWASHTGDWEVSSLIHPNGLKDVSKAAHDAGMKFMLWFEPERVINTTPVALRNPEYFLASDSFQDQNRLLNLGNSEAWKYCFETVSKLIEKLSIDCYRQDFNFSPLSYWRKNDDYDRQGITEIKHINGLYKFWDALLEKFPHLIIDNCASGGRRIDIETLRRSIPMWRSDNQCPANYDTEASQCHNHTFSLWMPYSGTGTGRMYDEYRIRSSYSASLATNYSFSLKETFCDTAEKVEFLKKYTNEYLQVRPYFSEDFYPLTECNDALDVWCAMQFDRPTNGDGIIEVFRRENSPYETAIFDLKGISENKNYKFTDLDGDEFMLSGSEIIKNGIRLKITEKRKAKIYLYQTV